MSDSENGQPQKGSRGKGVVVRPEGGHGEAAPGVGKLGMAVFLASLTMLFASGLVAYLAVRLRTQTWRPPGAPGPPAGLWVSTLFLVGCSVAAQRALGRIRAGDGRGMSVSLNATLALALGFSACQIWNWVAFYRADVLFEGNLYGFSFYMLTGLHALHVLGGLVAAAVVTYRARTGAYSWAYYPGVRHNATYWHYLGLVWLVLLAVLLAG